MATTTTEKKPNWFLAFVASSIGRKILMALTGIFLILFLTVHLAGNLQLLFPILFGEAEAGRKFNEYAHFMGHNEIIQLISIGNFTFILLHIIVSIWLTRSNIVARPVGYAYNGGNRSSWQSRTMMILGTIVLIFLAVHLPHFWAKSKFGGLEEITYNGVQMHNLYAATVEAFKQEWAVILYVLSMIGLAFHLSHGFQSAFQTLGLNHKKYTPFIKTLGFLYSIIVPVGFALIPILMYFF
jgi:succinate dehydrogenase / fumarate reductase cytochrome b subunit